MRHSRRSGGHRGVRPRRRQRRLPRPPYGRQRPVGGAPRDGPRARLAFSRDGSVLATASDDGSVGIWDVPTGRLRERFAGHAGAAVAPLFSPDGTTLDTGSGDGSEIVWDVLGNDASDGRSALPRARARPGRRSQPDGPLFATSPAPGRVTLWRARDEVPSPAPGPVRLRRIARVQPRWPPGRGERATAAHRRLDWSRPARSPRRSGRTSARRSGVAFSTDDRLLGTAGTTACCALRPPDAAAGRQRGPGTLQDLDFSSDGERGGGRLPGDILSKRGPAAARAHDHHHDGILAIRFAPDGRTIATGGIPGRVNFWDPQRGAGRRPLGGQNGLVFSVAFDPSGGSS